MISPETCDDGTAANGDGCNPTCTGNATGWSCTDGNTTSASTCSYICGDGYIVTGETCDDGSNNGVGCNSTCNGIITGYLCTNGGGTPASTCNFVCGDGLVMIAGAELCDDGNTFDGVGCDTSCTGNITGWYCSGGNSVTASTCINKCGDGFRVTGEACDDLNRTVAGNKVGCKSDCSG